jgi:hypothetical protein
MEPLSSIKQLLRYVKISCSQPSTPFQYDYAIFHTPFAKIVQKATARLVSLILFDVPFFDFISNFTFDIFFIPLSL